MTSKNCLRQWRSVVTSNRYLVNLLSISVNGPHGETGWCLFSLGGWNLVWRRSIFFAPIMMSSTGKVWSHAPKYMTWNLYSSISILLTPCWSRSNVNTHSWIILIFLFWGHVCTRHDGERVKRWYRRCPVMRSETRHKMNIIWRQVVWFYTFRMYIFSSVSLLEHIEIFKNVFQ